MSNETERPATKADVQAAIDGAMQRMENFVLKREASLIWKVIVLQVTLIGAISGAMWGSITWMMVHWKP